jgi:hypothetical protein
MELIAKSSSLLNDNTITDIKVAIEMQAKHKIPKIKKQDRQHKIATVSDIV